MKKWYQSKAIWSGAALVLTSIGGYLSGELDLPNALAVLFAALQGIFLRAGMGVKIEPLNDSGPGK